MAPDRGRFLVIICNPPKPAPRVMSSPQVMRSTTDVAWATARDASAAAEQAEVAPGGHVFVVAEADVRRFERPKVSPLTETHPSGEQFPEAG